MLWGPVSGPVNSKTLHSIVTITAANTEVNQVRQGAGAYMPSAI